MTWIQTSTGRAFDLLAPTVEMVRIEDIAHALSRINRFSGHTRGEPYSVAHHSMLVADLLASWGAPPAIVREGLLHDAGEAYYGDLTSPLKSAMRERSKKDENLILDFFRRVSRDIDSVVRTALSLPEHEHPLAKRADLVALAIERRDLFGGLAEPRDWALHEYAPTSAPCGRLWGKYGGPPIPPRERERIGAADLCSWEIARDRFLALLSGLDAEIGGAS